MEFTIKNVLSIKDAKFELGNTIVIAGKNNFGKSTINKVVYFVIQTMIDYNKYKRYVEVELSNLSVDEALKFIDSEFLLHGYSNESSNIQVSKDTLLEYVLVNMTEDYFHKTVSNSDVGEGVIELYNDEDLLFRFSCNSIVCNSPSPYSNIIFLSNPSILNYANAIRNTQEYSKLYDINLIKFIDRLRGTPLTVNRTGSIVVTSKDGVSREISDLGTGYGITLLIKTLCKVMPKGSLLILDEPDGALHTEYQVNICRYIKESGLVVIVTTHSPLMIRQLSDCSGYKFIGFSDLGVIDTEAKFFDYTMELDKYYFSNPRLKR